MKKSAIIKTVAALIVLSAGTWLYLTEFQKYRIRALVEQARAELVSGRRNYSRFDALNELIVNATLPSVGKYGERYLYDYSQSGNPEKFATGIMLDRPDLRRANGMGRSYTIPISIMLLEDAKRYPPATGSFMEEIACTLLPKAAGMSFGIEGLRFAEAADERAAALQRWREWYEVNKHAVLEDDLRRKAAVDAHIDKQKKFLEGLNDLGR